MNASMPETIRYARPDGGVVVGDDGSDGAEGALRYGLEEARRRGATLHVVRAWSIMSTTRPADVPPGIAASLAEYEAGVLAEQQTRMAGVLGVKDGKADGVPVQVHCAHAPAAQALMVASETADVLVVGTRGRGGFRSLVLGSVAEQAIRHASSPVVVVRPTD
jgi:nucleotide-binding universal stress UspA family protein